MPFASARNYQQELRALFSRNIRVFRAIAFIGAYGSWVLVFRLLLLSFVTYFLASSSSQAPRFEEIHEAFGSNELTLMGLSALIFVLLLRALNPLTSTTSQEIFTPSRIEARLIPGFWSGAVLATGVILAFLLSGLYRYIGFFIHFEEGILAAGLVLLRVAALAILAYCEEFVFRHKITRHVRMAKPNFATDVVTAILTGLLYCAIKNMQFDLGMMHLITLFLLSLALSFRGFLEEDFYWGAGFLAGLLIVFHPLCSLPVLGNEFTGVLLIKHQANMEGLSRILTGGAGGPFASLAFQALLAFDIVRSVFRLARKTARV